MTYVVPNLKLQSYTCPHCNVYTSQQHYNIENVDFEGTKGLEHYTYSKEEIYDEKFINYVVSECYVCKELHLWFERNVVYPVLANVPKPNNDLPDSIKELYIEASRVFNLSPKSAAALLRLAIERLLEIEGYTQNNLNGKIKAIVEKGVSDTVQKGLDSIRYFGNKGVHPGEVNLNEKKEDVEYLFYLINIITEELISRPKQVDDFYDKLPEGYKASINQRDQK